MTFDAEGVRALEDACLVLWAEMPAAEARSLRDEFPALVDFLVHLHHRVEHEQAMVRQNVWATAAAEESGFVLYERTEDGMVTTFVAADTGHTSPPRLVGEGGCRHRVGGRMCDCEPEPVRRIAETAEGTAE